MKKSINITLTLSTDGDNVYPFAPLLHRGFLVKTQIGVSIRDLLCSQYCVPEERLNNYIKIIFLDGKPVDYPDKAIVKDGSTIALSPYLGGIACRSLQRDSPISSFRSDISHLEEVVLAATSGEALVTIKLFNLLGGELGPMFLKQGIWITKEHAELLFVDRWHALHPFILEVRKNGEVIAQNQLAVLNWSIASEHVLIQVATQTSSS